MAATANVQAKRRIEPRAAHMTNPDPIRVAFLRRSQQALDRIAAEAPIESLTEALAATTDVGSLARILGDRHVIGAAVAELEPIAPMIARNATHRLALLDTAGGTLSAEEVGEFLGISRQAVDKRRRVHGLLGLRLGSDWRYPRCQFDEARHEVVAGLPRLLAGFAKAGPWVALDFLLASDDSLDGKSPLDVLRMGGWTASLERLLRIEQGDGFA